jgi:RNA polymerase sigma-70 factor (ECF subfamily)
MNRMTGSISARGGAMPSAAGPSDEGLEGRLAEGDVTAFDRVVARHGDRIAGLAFRLLGWPADVEDVVQDVFLAVWRHRRRFRGHSSLDTWLTAITLNQCRTIQRKHGLRTRLLARMRSESRRSASPAADNAAERRDVAAIVQRAVRALPHKDREVVVLRDLEGMSVEGIAEVLSVSANAVHVRLSRARARLRVMLESGRTECSR